MIQPPTHRQWIPADPLPQVEEAAVTIDHIHTALEYRNWVLAGVMTDESGASATYQELNAYIIELSLQLALNRFQPLQNQPPPMEEFQEVAQQLQELRNEMQEHYAVMRNEMQEQYAALRIEMHQHNTAIRHDIQEFRREVQQNFQQGEVTQRKLYNATGTSWGLVPNADGEYPPEPLPRLTSLAILQQLNAQELEGYWQFYGLPEGPADQRRSQIHAFLTHPFLQ